MTRKLSRRSKFSVFSCSLACLFAVLINRFSKILLFLALFYISVNYNMLVRGPKSSANGVAVYYIETFILNKMLSIILLFVHLDYKMASASIYIMKEESLCELAFNLFLWKLRELDFFNQRCCRVNFVGCSIGWNLIYCFNPFMFDTIFVNRNSLFSKPIFTSEEVYGKIFNLQDKVFIFPLISNTYLFLFDFICF